eukprot:TRINITY_DN14825_c0_g1_i1.p1 TRINITY_DN14825_c0_g1~~TRINITY_DN14825_c0_g1_i1.p1  ORF type:complete len:194 (-),score=47.49 TRINITY_DN14825_c0_g1_i1:231-743(-)
MADKTDAKAKDGKKTNKSKEPFVPVTPLKDVFFLFADRKTKLLPLKDVPYVLRALGLTIYGEEEQKIKAEVEKIDGLGKPVSYSTLQNWCDENQRNFTRSYDDAYNALATLCQEEIIAQKQVISIPWLKHLVSEVGDKLPAETVDKILKTDSNINGDHCSLDDLISALQK